MSGGTGNTSAAGAHTCNVCKVTLSSFMSYQIHCSGYLHSSNLAAKNVQDKSKQNQGNSQAGQAKKDGNASGGGKKEIDMFDPFISDVEVKSFLNNTKNQNKNPNQKSANQIPSLMAGMTPKSKNQRGNASFNPRNPHNQPRNQGPSGSYIDLTNDDAGYMNELNSYRTMRMRNESQLQNQLNRAGEGKKPPGKGNANQKYGNQNQGYRDDTKPVDMDISDDEDGNRGNRAAAAKKNQFSLTPDPVKPIVYHNTVVANSNTNLGHGMSATVNIGTHFVAGTPLGPNDMQFYFNNSLRAEDVMFEKHADPENYKNKPFDLAVAMGICPICPDKTSLMYRAVDWFCHVESKHHDKCVQALILKHQLPHVKKKFGIASIPQKYLTKPETYQVIQNILKHYERMFPAQMQKPIKAKYCAYVILTGQEFKYECKLCKYRGRHMADWIHHVLGSVHAKTCIQTLIKLGLEQYLRIYDRVPGPNPQNYWPIVKQFPLCLLPGIQGTDNLDMDSYKWTGFVHMDMADPKNNIKSRLIDGKLRPKPNKPVVSKPAATPASSSGQWGNNPQGGMPHASGTPGVQPHMTMQGGPGAQGPRPGFPGGPGPRPGMPAGQGPRPEMPGRPGQPTPHQGMQGQPSPHQGMYTSPQMLGNTSLTSAYTPATASASAFPGNVEPDPNLVEMVKKKVEAEVLSSFQQNNVLLKALIGALAQQAGIDVEAPTSAAGASNRVVLDYSHGQKDDATKKPQEEEHGDRDRPYSSDQRDRPYSDDQRDRPYSDDQRDRPYSDDQRDRPYSGDQRDRPYSGDQRDRPYSDDQRDRTYSDDQRDRSFSDDRRDRTYSSEQRDRTYSGEQRDRTYSSEQEKNRNDFTVQSSMNSSVKHSGSRLDEPASSAILAAAPWKSQSGKAQPRKSDAGVAQFGGASQVAGAAQIGGTSQVSRAAQVAGTAQIGGAAQVSRAAQNAGAAQIGGPAPVARTSQIGGAAQARQDASSNKKENKERKDVPQNAPQTNETKKTGESLIKWKYNWKNVQSNKEANKKQNQPVKKSEPQTPVFNKKQNQTSKANNVPTSNAIPTIINRSKPQTKSSTASQKLKVSQSAQKSAPVQSQQIHNAQNNPVMVSSSLPHHAAGMQQTQVAHIQAAPVMYVQGQVMPVVHSTAAPMVRPMGVMHPGYRMPNAMPNAMAAAPRPVVVGNVPVNPVMNPHQAGFQPNAIPRGSRPVRPPIGPPGLQPVILPNQQVPVSQMMPTSQIPPQFAAGSNIYQAAATNNAPGNTNLAGQQPLPPWKNKSNNKQNSAENKHRDVQKAFDMVDQERNRDDERRPYEDQDRRHTARDRYGESNRREPQERMMDENFRNKDDRRGSSSRGDRSLSRERRRHYRQGDDSGYDRESQDRYDRSKSRDRSRRDRTREREDSLSRRDDEKRRRRPDRDERVKEDDTVDQGDSRHHRSKSSEIRARRDERERRRRDEAGRSRRDEDYGEGTSQGRESRSRRSRTKNDDGSRGQELYEPEFDQVDDRRYEDRDHDRRRSRRDRNSQEMSYKEESGYGQADSERDPLRESSIERRRREREERHRKRRLEDNGQEEMDFGLAEKDPLRESSMERRRREREERHRKRRLEVEEDPYGKRRYEGPHSEDRDRREEWDRGEDEDRRDDRYRGDRDRIEGWDRRDIDEDFGIMDPNKDMSAAEIEARVQKLIYSLGIRDENVAAPLIALAAQMDQATLQQLLNPDFLTAVGQLREVLEDGTDITMLATLLDSDVMKDEGIYQLLQLLGLDVATLRVLHENKKAEAANQMSQRQHARRRR